MTEQEMREAKVPWFDEMDELVAYIKSLVERQHDYGTCVYAMSMAAIATQQYVSRKLGVTGFQAFCADMDFIRRSRGLDGPFMLLDGSQTMYPQHDILKSVDEWLTSDDMRQWQRETAQKHLDKRTYCPASRAVTEHWERLARDD